MLKKDSYMYTKIKNLTNQQHALNSTVTYSCLPLAYTVLQETWPPFQQMATPAFCLFTLSYHKSFFASPTNLCLGLPISVVPSGSFPSFYSF